MNDKGYIAKKAEGSSLFEELHLEALEIVQTLCSAVWTDYNEHDPGVTLLENISYALTELIHKTSLPVEDLLITSEEMQLRSGDNALFVASDILTTGPVTFNDHRKIWIDQVKNVENVWIYHVNEQKRQKKGSGGLLHVVVEKYEYRSDPEEAEEENKKIVHDITTQYQAQRNLCEDLYKVEVCKVLEVTMELEATITQESYGEEVLAEILYNVDDYITPQVNYYSLGDLQQKKIAVNTIFNGPRLPNGFIAEEDLKAPLGEVVISEITKIISQIPGIINIDHFCLHYTVPATGEVLQMKDHFQVPKDTVLKIAFPQSNEKLIFKSAGVFYKPDLTRAKQKFSLLVAAYYKSFSNASSALNTLHIPKGQYRDVASYYPIRKQLPELYGVGDQGISAQAPTLRRAQIRQLQAYLMPFDQLMVNFLSQLRHIYTLFDTQNTQETSYFSQVLPDIEQLTDLIQYPEGDHNSQKIKTCWKRILNDVNARFDTHSLQRHHQIADHLLARFNEVFHTYTLSKIQSISYDVPIYTEDNTKVLLAAKRKLLREYASISYRRTQSFHYQRIAELIVATGECTQAELLPGALQQVAILTGMDDFTIKSLIKNLETSGITIHPKTIHLELTLQNITLPGNTEELLEIEDIKVKEVVEENLYQVMHYVGNHDTILEDILKNGVLPYNYSIKKEPKKNNYYIVYKNESNPTNIAHIANSREEAQEVIQKAINYLSEISRKSEGFFAVEHLLLMPPYHEEHYGFHIDFSVLSEELNITVQQYQQTSCLERNKTITTLKEQLLANSLTYTTVQEGENYRLEIRNSKGNPIAVSTTQHPSPNAAEQQAKAIQHLASTLQEDQWDAAIKCYAYYGQNRVDECFFTFQLSLIAPNWPVRFQNENFKKMLENTLYEQLPIHIKSSIYWLNYNDLRQFEDYYFKWLKNFTGEHTGKERMHHAYQLVTMLQDLGQQREAEPYRVS